MRKSLLISISLALCCIFNIQQATAQITAVSIHSTSRIDSFNRSCVPSTLLGYLSGTVTGSYTSMDSLTIRYLSGDGYDSTFKIGIGSSSSFFASLYSRYTYYHAGIYAAQAIVTAASGAADTISTTIISDVCRSVTWYGVDTGMFHRYCDKPYHFVGYMNLFIDGGKSGDSAIVHLNYGDGSDTTFVQYSVSGSPFFPVMIHDYSISGSYTPVVHVTFLGLTDTFRFKEFTLNDSCATLRGKLFIDNNGNCAADAGELRLQGILIRAVNTITPDTILIPGLTDTSGEYSIGLKPGSYMITPLVNPWTAGGWTGTSSDPVVPSCPSTGSATLSVTASGVYTHDFAYECALIDSIDYSVVVSSTCYAPGDTTFISLWGGESRWLVHYNCLSLTTTVTLTLDPKLTYTGTVYGLAPTSVSGSVLSWNLSGYHATTFSSTIMAMVSATATLGDSLRCTAYITPATGVTDPYLTNNTHEYVRAVVSSYDPNMKESAPAGSGPKGVIPANTPMTYTIHFQNTGTAPAKNITVTDELEDNLEVSSFHMLTATHNVEVYRDGKTVKFRFNNINLPDSGSNYFGSMGAVTFAILPKRDLAPGTEIKNNASIYFDYNAPVITNYTLNTIESGTAIQEVKGNGLIAHIFPNPAHTELNVTMDNKNELFTVTMTDMLGRVVSNNAVQGAIVIPTQQLPAGLYLLSIKDGNGRALNTKVMIQH